MEIKGIDKEAETTGNPFADAEIIYTYTRYQAIHDGILVDVTETAKECGFKIPVAITAAAWGRCVGVPKGVRGQDEAGRLWDVLWMCWNAIRAIPNPHARDLQFQVYVRDTNRRARLVTLKANIGPGDEGEPVLTIMMPDED